jgi:hypothetical protein
MANQVYVSQPLTPRNAETEINNAVQSLIKDRLRRYGITFAPPDVVHRMHVFIIHAKAPNEKERALWW